ncbi:hypothetical protein VNO77_04479 [Canavalia gladiata]|uniref:Uncharacterized protein n=1 Tax=Canavalia gladiata TaxID=3824 RepID=A0AAN9N1P6_CANGL
MTKPFGSFQDVLLLVGFTDCPIHVLLQPMQHPERSDLDILEERTSNKSHAAYAIPTSKKPTRIGPYHTSKSIVIGL